MGSSTSVPSEKYVISCYKEDALLEAIKSDDLEFVIRVYEEQGRHIFAITNNSTALDVAALSGSVRTVTWLLSKHCPFADDLIYDLAYSGFVDMLRLVLDSLSDFNASEVVENGLYSGSLKMVEYLFERGLPFSEYSMDIALESSNLEVLAFLSSKGFRVVNGVHDFTLFSEDVIDWLTADMVSSSLSNEEMLKSLVCSMRPSDYDRLRLCPITDNILLGTLIHNNRAMFLHLVDSVKLKAYDKIYISYSDFQYMEDESVTLLLALNYLSSYSMMDIVMGLIKDSDIGRLQLFKNLIEDWYFAFEYACYCSDESVLSWIFELCDPMDEQRVNRCMQLAIEHENFGAINFLESKKYVYEYKLSDLSSNASYAMSEFLLGKLSCS